VFLCCQNERCHETGGRNCEAALEERRVRGIKEGLLPGKKELLRLQPYEAGWGGEGEEEI